MWETRWWKKILKIFMFYTWKKNWIKVQILQFSGVVAIQKIWFFVNSILKGTQWSMLIAIWYGKPFLFYFRVSFRRKNFARRLQYLLNFISLISDKEVGHFFTKKYFKHNVLILSGFIVVFDSSTGSVLKTISRFEKKGKNSSLFEVSNRWQKPS